MFKQEYEQKEDYIILYTRKKDYRILIDAEDLQKIIKLNKTWWLSTNGYVQTSFWNGKYNKSMRIHRFILNYTGKLDVDHINGNRLDNRKSNLRICTRSQNLMNRHKSVGTSGVIGVVFDKSRNKWASRIKINSKHINLGRFANKGDAILMRLLAEDKYFKQYGSSFTS